MKRMNGNVCTNAREVCLSARSYFSFMKVCFAGLYFASLKENVRTERPVE